MLNEVSAERGGNGICDDGKRPQRCNGCHLITASQQWLRLCNNRRMPGAGTRGKRTIILLMAAATTLMFGWRSGYLLIVDNAQRSDVALVLAGDTHDRRFRAAIELLH